MSASRFDSWDTPKLGAMVQIARQRVTEANAAFAATQAEERRLRKRTYLSEQAELHCRRAEDRLDEMRAELLRRALECFVERRTYPRLGPEFRRRGFWDQLPAPESGTLPSEAKCSTEPAERAAA